MTGSVWAGGPSNVLTSKLVKEIALSDMVSNMLAQIDVAYFRVFAPFRMTGLYASVKPVNSSGICTVDMNLNGVSLLSTKLTIDANESDSRTAAAPYVLVGGVVFKDFAIGDEVVFDIDTVGVNGKGLVVYILGFDL